MNFKFKLRWFTFEKKPAHLGQNGCRLGLMTILDITFNNTDKCDDVFSLSLLQTKVSQSWQSLLALRPTVEVLSTGHIVSNSSHKHQGQMQFIDYVHVYAICSQI